MRTGPIFPKKGEVIGPAELRNVAKYEGLQDLAQLPRKPYTRSSWHIRTGNYPKASW